MIFIEWTEPAFSDLENIRDYIGKDSPHYARQFLERIFNAVEKLIDHPFIGRQVPEANRDDVRELIFYSYRIIYLTQKDRIRILSVIHGNRKISKKATKQWEV